MLLIFELCGKLTVLRWTAHCAFGSIHRFHGNDHRPWTYTPHVEDVVRRSLKAPHSSCPDRLDLTAWLPGCHALAAPRSQHRED